MTKKSDKDKRITIRLTDEQMAVIQEVDGEFNFDNISTSVRHIINEYAKRQGKKTR